jgi:NAD(P)-dependent dehydrogenase (short-subunit alcohol dehydrogenase family)
MRLDGRTALITGAGSGMGQATAVRFAEEGAHVLVADIDIDSAAYTVELIEKTDGSAESLELDVADKSAIDRAVFDLGRRFTALHVLFNHAGVPGPAELALSEERWDRIVDINMKGGYFLTSAALPLLRNAAGKASIIFTASTAGVVGSISSPLYSLTKGGVVLLAKSLALQLATEGIRVNALCPGPVVTPMLPQFFDRERGSNADDLIERLAAGVPMGRPARPEEIANAALFLACDESSYVTGIALPVDGGYLAR